MEKFDGAHDPGEHNAHNDAGENEHPVDYTEQYPATAESEPDEQESATEDGEKDDKSKDPLQELGILVIPSVEQLDPREFRKSIKHLPRKKRRAMRRRRYLKKHIHPDYWT